MNLFRRISFYYLFLIFTISSVHSFPFLDSSEEFIKNSEEEATTPPVGIFNQNDTPVKPATQQHHVRGQHDEDKTKTGQINLSPESRDCTSGNCPIASKSTGWTCEQSHECRNSPLGDHSICERNVSPPMPGGTGRCSCFDWHKLSSDRKDVRLEGSRCALVRKIGESCEDSRDCNDTNIGEAECAVGIGFLGLTCKCKGNWTVIGPETCAPVAQHEGALCSHNDQCTKGILGPLSKCMTGRCKCDDTTYPHTLPTIYYKNRCYYERVLGDPCETHEECQGSIHPKAECKGGQAYLPNTKTCQCDQGKCDGPPEPDAGFISTSNPLLIILPIFTLQFFFNY